MVVKVKQQQSFSDKFAKSALIAKIGLGLVIFIIVVLLGYFFDTVKQQKTIKNLKTDKTMLAAQLASLDLAVKKQLLITHNLATLEQYLVTRSKDSDTTLDQSKLLKQFHDMGAKQQIHFNYIKPNSLKIKPYYTILPIEISLTGDYHHVAQFISDISNTQQPFLMTELMFKHEPKSDNLMSLVISGDLYTLHSNQQEVKYYPKYILKNAKGASESLPNKVNNVRYDKLSMRDPFTKMKVVTPQKYSNVILREVPLSKITVSGTITTGGKKWAIIMPTESKDDKMTHNVSVGERISQSQALITSIKPYEVVLEKDATTSEGLKTETVTLEVADTE